MIILKRWLREFLSLFVFIRFKDFFTLHEYLHTNNIKSGINASVYTHYCDSHSAFIGINTEFKNRPYLPHGLNGIFISENSKIGKNAIIFQNVTIGSSILSDSKTNGSPIIGDNCYIGTGACIIGDIKIGNNVRIGANTNVYEDIPDNSVVVSSPSRIIKKRKKLDNRFIKNIDNKKYYWDFETKTFKEI